MGLEGAGTASRAGTSPGGSRSGFRPCPCSSFLAKEGEKNFPLCRYEKPWRKLLALFPPFSTSLSAQGAGKAPGSLCSQVLTSLSGAKRILQSGSPGKSSPAPESTWELLRSSREWQGREADPHPPLLQPLTRLLGLLGQLLGALGAVGHWVSEGSILLAGAGVLPGRVVRDLNLQGGETSRDEK